MALLYLIFASVLVLAFYEKRGLAIAGLVIGLLLSIGMFFYHADSVLQINL